MTTVISIFGKIAERIATALSHLDAYPKREIFKESRSSKAPNQNCQTLFPLKPLHQHPPRQPALLPTLYRLHHSINLRPPRHRIVLNVAPSGVEHDCDALLGRL
jgi:hypothetical protein